MDPYRFTWDASALGVGALGAAYLLSLRRDHATGARVASFLAGCALLLAVLLGPVETLALHDLVVMHLLQNVVLAEWAPLLCVAALGPALARSVERALGRSMHPLVALPVWLATSYAWHLPWLFDAALRHPWTLLQAEHASYFLAGCLVWWPVVHGRWASGTKAGYLFAAFVLVSPLGLLLALLPRPIYDYPVHAPPLWGLSRLADQQLAGTTMASEQAVVFFAAFAFCLRRFFVEEEQADAFRAPTVPRASARRS